ncbi:MAG: trans-aconitate 2-methyltransferase [Dehalococcoidia bacterium]
MTDEQPRMYTDLAPWFHLVTAPEDYAEEEAFYRRLIVDASSSPPQTLLEIGSGGGNMASHYKRHFQATLVELSESMLDLSRSLNPECEHIQGDMRSVRLGRQFDAVFVHDAIMYMTTLDDLRLAIETAYLHCRPGGVAVFAPDHVRENFVPSTDCGGHDGDGRALRYLEWSWDPDPTDTTYLVDYAYLLREEGQPVRTVHDRHIEGLFGRGDWLRLLEAAGFRAEVRPLVHSEVPEGSVEVFVAVRPDG